MARRAVAAAALVACAAWAIPAGAQAKARPAHGVDGAGLVRMLGARATRAYAAPGAGGIGAQVILPPGVRGADLGIMDLAPGFARFRGSPDAIAVFAAAHPDVGVEVAPPLHTLLDTVAVTVGANTAIAAGLDGTGVLVGIADTGVDVTHPDFLDASGHSRVAWYLDLSVAPLGLHADLESQFGSTDVSGKPVGAVWSAADLDAAAAALRTLPIDELGHGTFVGSCAAGNGMGGTSKYRGIAPGATLLVARVTPAGSGAIDTDYLLLGAAFLFDRAQAMGQPVVVNLSIGTDFGPHDGTLAWEQTLAGYVGPSQPGRALVAAAGNSGSIVDTPVHQNVHVSPGATIAVPIVTYGAVDGGIQVWVATRPGDSIKVGLDGPDGQWIAPVPPGKSAGKDGAGYQAGVYNGNQPAGSPVPADSQGAVVVWDGTWPQGTYDVTLSGSGTADLYVVATGDAGDVGTVGFAQAVRDATIVLPATQASIIGVGCTINKPSWTGSNGVFAGLQVPEFDPAGATATGFTRDAVAGEPCWFSSAGPTLTGLAKPDIMAPGGAIVAAMSQDAVPPAAANSIFASGQCPPTPEGFADSTCQLIDTFHAVSFGTSFSSPVVAGAVAILLQHDPTLTEDEVLAALQGGAHPLRAPAVFEDQAGPGEVDVLGALLVADRIRDPQVVIPSRVESWLTPTAQFYRADGSTPFEAILELRAAAAPGAAPLAADGFASDRLAAYAEVGGAAFPGGVQSLARRGPGVWLATVALPAGLGGQTLTLGATFDGAPVVASVTVPIATDAWNAEYPASIAGACAVAGGAGVRPGDAWLGALAALVALGALAATRTVSASFARRPRRDASSRWPRARARGSATRSAPGSPRSAR